MATTSLKMPLPMRYTERIRKCSIWIVFLPYKIFKERRYNENHLFRMIFIIRVQMSIKSKLNGAVKFVSDEGFRLHWLASHHFYDSMGDKEYLRRMFRARLGYDLNLEDPKTFNEKLQWLKLYDRKPEYTTMVDKVAVKGYVADIIGMEHIIPTLGVWNNPDDIDFNRLPNQFVLKCNHNSGLGMCICKDKTKLNIKKVRSELNKGLKEDTYLSGREWPYKNVPRKILAEKYMIDDKTCVEGLTDYKIHCFNGEPIYLQVIGNRDHKKHTAFQLFYTFDWKPAGWSFGDYPKYLSPLDKPMQLKEMKNIARLLCKDHSYLRVDLYEINQVVYFGELTFSPLSGFYTYNKEYNKEADLMLGEMIKLPQYKVTDWS